MQRQQRGFTLIEILVVVIIIALATTFVFLNLGNRSDHHRIAAFAEHLSELIPIAQQTAILQPAVLALQITPKQYRWLQYVQNIESHGQWQPIITDTLLATHDIPNDILVKLQVLNSTTDSEQLVITASGEFTPFIIDIYNRDRSVHYRITGKANGEINLLKLG